MTSISKSELLTAVSAAANKTTTASEKSAGGRVAAEKVVA